MPVQPAITCTHLSFAWPDGSRVLDDLSVVLGAERTGLVGRNGAGKSTFLRLVASGLKPTSGSVTTSGAVDYLPQHLTLGVETRLADLLGIGRVLEAVRAVERGSVDPALFDAIGTEWDVEARAVAALAEVGLPTDLDRRVGSLSGGESTLAAVTGIRVRRAPIALLDEPTNNLDRESRARLYSLVRSWKGALVLASHDRDLLELADATAEVRDQTMNVVGGPFSAWRDGVARQQLAAEQSLKTARQALRTEQRQRTDVEQKIAHGIRKGRTDRDNSRYIKAVVDKRRNAAEKSAGTRRGMLDARVAAARDAVDVAKDRIRDDDRIRVSLPDSAVPRGRRLAVLTGSDGRQIVLAGPQRVALTGPNGVGKTTLLTQLLGSGRVQAARAEALTPRIGYLPQRLDNLDDEQSVIDTLRAVAPNVTEGELRSQLAGFLLRGDAVHRLVGDLSGGERFRVALAGLLLADPPPELLVLDEPTNNLDLDSVDQLVDALDGYRGAILIASHDEAVLARVGLTLRLDLAADGRLVERRQ